MSTDPLVSHFCFRPVRGVYARRLCVAGRFLTGGPRSDNKILGTDICSRAADCKSYKRFRALTSFNTISRETVMSCYKRLGDRGDLISGTKHGEAWT